MQRKNKRGRTEDARASKNERVREERRKCEIGGSTSKDMGWAPSYPRRSLTCVRRCAGGLHTGGLHAVVVVEDFVPRVAGVIVRHHVWVQPAPPYNSGKDAPPLFRTTSSVSFPYARYSCGRRHLRSEATSYKRKGGKTFEILIRQKRRTRALGGQILTDSAAGVNH